MIFSFVHLYVVAALCHGFASLSSLKRQLETTSCFSESNSLNLKRAKQSDNEAIIEKLRDSIISDYQEKCDFLLKRDGCDFMDPKVTNLLETAVIKGKSRLLSKIFNSACADRFDLFVEAIKLSEEHNRPVLHKLLEGMYMPFTETPQWLLIHFVEKEDFETLLKMIEYGYNVLNFRTSDYETLVHMAVRHVRYDLIRALAKSHPTIFARSNIFNQTPLTLAKDHKMIKTLRRIYPKGRDFRNSVDGLMIWQEVLLKKDFAKLDSMISFSRRVKKLRRSFMNFHKVPWVSSAKILQISRENLFRDSFLQVSKKAGSEWFKPNYYFFIKFIGEVGLDAGGLKVEWISELFKAFFADESEPKGNAKHFTAPLFLKVDDETQVYAPNTEYPVQVFKFAGSIAGLSLALGVPMGHKFIPAIPKFIFNEKIDLENDLQMQSPTLHRHLQSLTDTSCNLTELDVRFITKPKVTVNRRNLPRFISEYSQAALHLRYESEIKAFVEGFKSVLSEKIENFVTLNEFVNVLQGGAEDFTAQEFAAACNNTDAALLVDLSIIIRDFSTAQRRLFLKFITGTDRLPVSGFAGLSQKPQVITLDTLAGKFPTSSTCSNLLKLPPYSDIEELRGKLIIAIELTGGLDHEQSLEDSEGIVLGLDDGLVLHYRGVDSDSDVSADEEEEEVIEAIAVQETETRNRFYRTIW